MQSWQLQEAKSRLSELIRLVKSEGPQAISVHGKTEAIVLSKKEYERLTGKKNSLVKFMQQSPLSGMHIELTRNSSKTRDLKL